MGICQIIGCGKEAIARGWCSAHYSRWDRHGSPTGGRVDPREARLYLDETVIPYQGDDCLIWPYGRSSNGYARLGVDYKRVVVSRMVCEAWRGPPPTVGHEAAHSCGRGKDGCVTGRHLRWATPSENQMDRVIHGNSNRGSRHGMSKLKEDQVLEIRDRLLKGETQTFLATEFGVSQPSISRIANKDCWGWQTEKNV